MILNNWMKSSSSLTEVLIVTGICPLLGAVKDFRTGLVMAILYILSLFTLALAVSATSRWIPSKLRIVVIVFFSVSIITVLHLIMQAYFYEQSQLVGIYAYLIAVSALVLVFARGDWGKIVITTSVKQVLILSMVVAVMLIIIGTAREQIELHLLTEPAGAFFTLALLMAVIKWFVQFLDTRNSTIKITPGLSIE